MGYATRDCKEIPVKKRMTTEQRQMVFALIDEIGFLGVVRELCNHASVQALKSRGDRPQWELRSAAMNDIYHHLEPLMSQWESIGEVKK